MRHSRFYETRLCKSDGYVPNGHYEFWIVRIKQNGGNPVNTESDA